MYLWLIILIGFLLDHQKFAKFLDQQNEPRVDLSNEL